MMDLSFLAGKASTRCAMLEFGTVMRLRLRAI